jgi:hypothetical protein
LTSKTPKEIKDVEATMKESVMIAV